MDLRIESEKIVINSVSYAKKRSKVYLHCRWNSMLDYRTSMKRVFKKVYKMIHLPVLNVTRGT